MALLRGRRGECEMLDRLLAAVRAGESRALVLGGEQIARFREVLREVEQEVREAASGGDYEAALHRIYRRHLSEVQIEGVGSFVKTEAIGAVVGGTVGLGTMGLTGPIGSLLGSGIGSAVGAVINARSFMRNRRARGWVAVDQELAKLIGP